MLLDASKSQLLIVDVQERLAPVIAGIDGVLARIGLMIAGARQLGVPVTVAQQNPRGLGATVETIRAALPNEAVTFDKLTFSCLRDDAIATHLLGLAGSGRSHLVVVGIETHICVLQSALDAAQRGLSPAVVADATGSRRDDARDLALSRLRHAGITVLDTEMALFEWLGAAGTTDFKAIAPLVK